VPEIQIARVRTRADRIGNQLVDVFQFLGLLVIGMTIVWSAAQECLEILRRGHAGIHDILTLFIYLELGAMVGIYFRTRRIPVQFLLYVAITALTRELAVRHEPGPALLITTGAVLVMALAVLVLQFANARYPDQKEDTRKQAFPDIAV
jgi:phosphate starvation-inducible membrane PsiE